MWKAISAMAAAAVLATALTILPGTNGVFADVAASARGDRDTGAECALRGWPYYRRECLKDFSRDAGRAAPARLVSTDRIHVPASAPLPRWAAYLPATHPGWTIEFTLGR